MTDKKSGSNKQSNLNVVSNKKNPEAKKVTVLSNKKPDIIQAGQQQNQPPKNAKQSGQHPVAIPNVSHRKIMNKPIINTVDDSSSSNSDNKITKPTILENSSSEESSDNSSTLYGSESVESEDEDIVLVPLITELTLTKKE